MAQYLCIWVGAYWFLASDVNFKMAAWRPYWIFCFRTLTLLWLWISTPNFSGTIIMYMGRSPLIFFDVILKMGAWQPYWDFWFPDSSSTLLWNFNFKFHLHVLCGCRQTPSDFQLCHFQNGCLVIFNNVQLQSIHCPLLPSPMGRGILVDHWSTTYSFI